ncbi:MAG: tetratricopeptide repeat protein [Oligoflexales bacterium]|nr:tetratricopeptide repeat protein [Oligoflexales bacterium]
MWIKNLELRQVRIPFLLCWLFTGCMSTQDGEVLKEDLFKAQKRLLELEHRFEKTGEESKHQGNKANKELASTNVRQDKLDADIRMLKGELGTLRQGVITGELPGFEEQADSIAKTLQSLRSRIEALEKTQLEILALLQKRKANKGKQEVTLKNLSDVMKAFRAKRYMSITRDTRTIIKKTKKEKVRDQLKFYYAESLFKVGRLRDAVLAFNELSSTKHLIEELPQVHLRIGDSFRLLGDKKAAVVYYKETVNKFPDSDEAMRAQEHIKKLDPKST